MTNSLTDASTWIRPLGRTAPAARIRLICFPHAGGSAGFYRPLAGALPADVDVLGVQYPGRQDRRNEPGATAIADLADRVADALRAYPDLPLVFFGHSMGAVVAYEVALRLQELSGAAVTRLFASGRRAPSRYRNEQIHLRDDAGILAEIQRLGGTAAGIVGDPELVEMIMPAIRSDYTAIETYRDTPGRLLRCPVTVLTGDRDPRTTPDEAAAWAAHTTGDSEVVTFPGGHFFVADRAAEVIALVADRCRLYLARRT